MVRDFAQTVDCPTTMPKREMNICAEQDWQKAVHRTADLRALIAC